MIPWQIPRVNHSYMYMTTYSLMMYITTPWTANCWVKMCTGSKSILATAYRSLAGVMHRQWAPNQNDGCVSESHARVLRSTADTQRAGVHAQITCSRACRPLVPSALHAPPRTRPSLVLAAGAGGACSKGLTDGAISGNFPGDTSEAGTLRADFCCRQGSVGFGLGFGLRRLVASRQLRDDRGGVQRRHGARRSRGASVPLQQRALCEHAAGRRGRRGRCSRLCLAALLHALWAQPAQGHTGAGAAPKAGAGRGMRVSGWWGVLKPLSPGNTYSSSRPNPGRQA